MVTTKTSLFKLRQPETYRTFAAVEQSEKRNKTATSAPALKLSIVTQFFPPDFAATGQLIEELARNLGELGIDVKVFSGQPGYAYNSAKAPRLERKGLVQIVRSRTTNLWGSRLRGKALNGLLFAVRTVLHLIRNCRRRDLVLVTTAPPFLPVLVYLVNVLSGVRYVCLLYDLYPDIAVELGVLSGQSWIAKGWRALNRRVWQRAEKLIALSPAMKQRIVQLCPEVEEKVHVIHSWADPEHIVPMPKSENWFAWKYGLVDKFTVLYSGNMGRCHDIDTIFEAALRLKNEPIQFVCIGGGAKRETLIQKAEEAELDNFLFLPYQDKDVLPYSLTACDLSLVSVSPGMESLVAPSKVYSALASGRAIAAICPSETYVREILAKGKCGDWFDNGDSEALAEFILTLSQYREQTDSMGRASRNCLEKNYTPSTIARRYGEILLSKD